ncbi:MAG: hypothetical protein ACK52S_23670 [Pirellula sp.]
MRNKVRNKGCDRADARSSDFLASSFAWKSIWLLLLVFPLVGCRGCNSDSASEASKAEDAKKKKQRLAADEMRALPFAGDSVGNFLKMGHWYQLRHKLKANFSDESLTAGVSVVDREGTPIGFQPGYAPYQIRRNVALAVGQEKTIEMRVLQPLLKATNEGSPADPGKPPNSSLFASYTLRGIGTPVLEETFPNKYLEGYQYNFVVLSREPARYTFWRGLDCIVWPRNDELQQLRISPHRIVDISESEVAGNFPNQLATMTSISHIVINDLSPSLMSEQQQIAMKDWLRFGGTLIINGPEAISAVESTFLKDLTPLQGTADSSLTEDVIADLDRDWSIRFAGGDRIPFKPNKSVPCLTGDLVEGASWVPSLQGLVAERLIGQGRVVMTTFPMSDAAFLNWPSYSSMIHNGILRKPHRHPTLGAEATTQYADQYFGTELNPFHTTRLRLWARDFDSSMMRSESDVKSLASTDVQAKFPTGKSTSLGAWNPSSRVIENSLLCLRESSGITVPQISTIVRLLAWYLVVLVPANWLVFRLIGKVELAWVAAPIIALVGAAVVARSVQLDVGFSRSQTTYGFLECHNDYPRGLLSSYNSLYTSLSTNYQAVFKKGDGLVVPIPRASNRKGSDDTTYVESWLADERGTGLQRYPVLSNTTGVLQSEEMVDFGGPVAWKLDEAQGVFEGVNKIGFAVRDIGILGITGDGIFMTGWAGTSENGEKVQGRLQPLPEGAIRWCSEWDENPLTAMPKTLRVEDGLMWTDQVDQGVYLGPMLQDFAQRYPLQRGEWIALGWTDNDLSGLEISPTTIQKKSRTLVLMHIRAGMLDDVRPDTRIFAASKAEDGPE